VNKHISGGRVNALEGQVLQLNNNNWNNKLYRTLNTSTKPVTVQLIPYYAWANRGQTDMRVWLPVVRANP